MRKKKRIIESGVLELVCQLPSHLFNHTTISPCLWLIDKEKSNKDIYFLQAERFSEWEGKKEILTSENIKQIINKDNWNLTTYQEIEKQNFIITPRRYENLVETKLSKEEIDQQLIQNIHELRHSLHLQITDFSKKLLILDNLEKSENQTEFYTVKKQQKQEKIIQDLVLQYGDLFFKQNCDTEIVIKDYFALISGNTPSTKITEYYQNGKIKFLNQGSLLDIYYLDDKIIPSRHITEKAFNENKMFFTRQNSILIPCMAQDSKFSRRIVWCQSDNYTYNPLICNLFSKDNNKFHTATLFFALRNQSNKLASIIVGSRGEGGRINIKEINNFTIPWVSNPKVQEKLFVLLDKSKVWC